MPSSTIASAWGSRATLATKLVPRSSICLLSVLVQQFRRRLKRRAHDRRIPRATAQMTAQHIADFFLVRLRVFAQESIQRHQNSGSAKAALQRVISLEGRLQHTKTARRRREAFHGPQFAAVDLHRECEAR